MYEGWLWLSILKIAAWPSPMSITPAFSPGPQITHGASVGSFFKWTREDLYEQCSDHMTEKMPSSTRFGSRPSAFRIRLYSSSLRPCSATISGVMRLASRTSMRGPLALSAKRRQRSTGGFGATPQTAVWGRSPDGSAITEQGDDQANSR